MDTRSPLTKVETLRMARPIVEFTRVPDEAVDLEAPYQRPSVWTLGQKVALIESVLRGIPITAIVVSDLGSDSDVHWRVVDGKQRLKTLIGFTRNEFAVPAWWFDHGAQDGGEVRWEDLSRVAKSDFLMTTIAIEEMQHPRGTTGTERLDAERGLYLLVNSAGTAHTDADLNRAR